MNYHTLNALQTEYCKTQSHKVWQDMYILCGEAASISLRNYIKAKSLKLKIEDFEDVREDITLRLMDRFKRTPGYRVRYWATALRNEIKHRLHNTWGNIIKPVDEHSVSWPNFDQFIDPRSEYDIEPSPDYDDIDSNRIIVDIATTQLPTKPTTNLSEHYKREFKTAILNVHGYTPKRLIYKYAPQLRAIFEETRKHGET